MRRIRLRLFHISGGEPYHQTGDEDCPACDDGYPRLCWCGGVIHGEAADYTQDFEPLYRVICDRDCKGAKVNA